MYALTDFLFPAPAGRQTASIIHWWEARRLAYNLGVGTAGAFTLGVVNLLAIIPPHQIQLKTPWEPVVAFGFCANVCYCFGPALEILAAKLFDRKLLPVGPTLFRMGLMFSLGLALLPSLVMSFCYAYRVLRFLIGG